MGIAIEGNARILAPRPLILIMLKEPDILEACVPGCEGLQIVSKSRSALTVTTWFGADKATICADFETGLFSGSGRFRVIYEADSIDMVLGHGHAHVDVADTGQATIVHYCMVLQVDDDAPIKLANFVTDAIKNLIDEFLGRLTELAQKMRAEDAEALG